MAKLTIEWINGSKVMMDDVDADGDPLAILRRLDHPVHGQLYWRDDVFSTHLFHGHLRIDKPFGALGPSVARASLIVG